MDVDYQKQYEHLYRHHWWYIARERCVLEIVKDLCKSRPSSILEVGCGPGILLPKLMQFGGVEGIEPAESSFEYGEDVGVLVQRISFPYESKKLPGEHYNLILLLDVLEHIHDDKAAVLEVERLLKKGGFAVITVPAFMSLWGHHDLVNHHFKRYTLPEIDSLMYGTRLRKFWGSYYFGWCFIPVWIVRHIQRILQKKNLRHDFKIPPAWLNKLLIFISNIDFKIVLRKGLPIGSSLIAVAKKDSV